MLLGMKLDFVSRDMPKLWGEINEYRISEKEIVKEAAIWKAEKNLGGQH